MRKAFVFRLYPTAKQTVALGQMLGAHREVYNAAVQERRDAWRQCSVSVKSGMQMAQLTEMRQARPDQARWSFTSQQQTLRRVEKAYAAFFRRVKTGQTPGYPRFRSRDRFDSVDFRHGDGIKFTPSLARTRARCGRSDGGGFARLRVQGIGTMKVLQHRPLPVGATLGQVSVKREGHGPRAKWFLVLPVEYVTAPNATPPTGRSIGLDLGTMHLATLTDHIPGLTEPAADGEGGHLPNPRHYRTAETELVRAQQALSRCKRGSARRKLARQKAAAVHARIRRTRADYLHKTARTLVDYADLIAVENITTANLTRTPKPVPDPHSDGAFLPNGAAAKAGLNKSILDAGWSTLLALLDAKAEEAGRLVIRVNPAYTSRDCSGCGHRKTDLTLSDREYLCTNCGVVLDRDINAARNILTRAGTAHRAAASAA